MTRPPSNPPAGRNISTPYLLVRPNVVRDFELSADGYLALSTMRAWSRATHRDGFVPAGLLIRSTNHYLTPSRCDTAVAELLAGGYLTEADDGWQLDWSEQIEVATWNDPDALDAKLKRRRVREGPRPHPTHPRSAMRACAGTAACASCGRTAMDPTAAPTTTSTRRGRARSTTASLRAVSATHRSASGLPSSGSTSAPTGGRSSLLAPCRPAARGSRRPRNAVALAASFLASGQPRGQKTPLPPRLSPLGQPPASPRSES